MIPVRGVQKAWNVGEYPRAATRQAAANGGLLEPGIPKLPMFSSHPFSHAQQEGLPRNGQTAVSTAPEEKGQQNQLSF